MALTQISTGGVKDDTADESKLKVSNAGSNGQFLQKQSGNTGGLTWASANQYTHPNHSGEVTSTADGAQVIASNVVDEDNLKVSNSPTNGQFLQAQSGNTGGLTWAEVSAAPEITATASGAIAANKPVILNSDGSVAAIVGSDDTQGSEFTINDGYLCYQWDTVWDPDNQKLILFYENAAQNRLTYYSVATISTSDNSVTWSTPAALGTSTNERTARHITACYDTNLNVIYVAVVWGNNSNNLRVRACTLSGTTLTIGNAWDVGGSYVNTVQHVAMAFNPDTNRTMIAWSRNAELRARTFKVDSATNLNSITGNSLYGEINYLSGTKLIYDTSDDRYLLLHNADGGSFSQSSLLPFTENSSNGTLTLGTVNQGFKSGDAWPMDCAWDPVNNKTFVVWTDRSGGSTTRKIYGAYATCSSGTITYGTNIEITGSVFDQGSRDYVPRNLSVVYNPDTKEMVVSYVDQTQNPNTRKVRLVRVSYGTTPTKKDAWELTTAAGSQTHINYDEGTDRGLVLFHAPDDNSELHGKAVKFASTTLKSNNFIGFNKTAVSNGQTATIKVNSNTTTQSSLTPATEYYVQTDGTLGTTAADPSVKAGIALSSTNLLIRS